MPTSHGHVHWNELNTTDIAKADDFYGAVLGWRIEEVGAGDTKGWLIRQGDQVVGGAFALEGPDFEGMMSHWFTYFAVADIGAAVEAVKAAGGTVVRGPFTVPATGTFAVIRDTTGGHCGFIQPEAGTG